MITLKSLAAKLTMIKLTAERRGVETIGYGKYPIANMRIQTGPGGKRLVAESPGGGTIEITSFMPARELNIWLNGFWNGIDGER